jgi:hypothetical protein
LLLDGKNKHWYSLGGDFNAENFDFFPRLRLRN